MSLFSPLTSIAAAEGKAAVGKVRRRAIIAGVAVLLALTAFVFLMVALHVYLVRLMGPQAAPLMIALGAILLILVVLLAGNIWIHMTEQSEKAERRRAEMRVAATAAVTTVPLLLRSPIVRRFVLPAIAVGGAAYLALRPGGPDRGR